MVTLTDQKGLFCHELSVSDAVENPTPFCTITGELAGWEGGQTHAKAGIPHTNVVHVWYETVCMQHVHVGSGCRPFVQCLCTSIVSTCSNVLFPGNKLHHIHTCTHTHTRTHARTHTRTHARTHAHTHTTHAGIVWQYGIISLAAWWLSHVCCIFWKVVFPLHAREHRRHQQYLYVVLTVASLLAPIPSIIAAFLTGGYAVNRFPPLMCGVKDLDVQYYSLWFVINVLWGVGITLLIIMFWRLHRVCNHTHTHTHTCTHARTHTHTHTRTHARTHMRTHVYLHAHIM